MNSEFQQPDEMENSTTESGNSHSRLAIEAYASREPIANTDSSNEVSDLERLPDAAREAAANGESSVLIATGSGEMVGAFLPIPVSEQLDAQVESVEALGFKAQVRWLDAGAGLRYELSASWDTEHHRELAQVTAAALQEKAEALAAKKATLSPCDDLFAVDAASALDENRLTDASKLIKDCSVESSGVVDPAKFKKVHRDYEKFQQFVELVSMHETDGEGLDITLKYGSGSGSFYLDGIEIK
ncbi:MAG: hypothetical protein C0508_09590 [Cyanobacteria bacterium PR.023]|nr:hypothetical protein [Cyanobacteria bacterium PR.023]